VGADPAEAVSGAVDENVSRKSFHKLFQIALRPFSAVMMTVAWTPT
jgi:hypothetical protein